MDGVVDGWKVGEFEGPKKNSLGYLIEVVTEHSDHYQIFIN